MKKCIQCGKEYEKGVEREIYSRDRDPYTRKVILKKQRIEFCSAECGGYHQMGCEG